MDRYRKYIDAPTFSAQEIKAHLGGWILRWKDVKCPHKGSLFNKATTPKVDYEMKHIQGVVDLHDNQQILLPKPNQKHPLTEIRRNRGSVETYHSVQGTPPCLYLPHCASIRPTVSCMPLIVPLVSLFASLCLCLPHVSRVYLSASLCLLCLYLPHCVSICLTVPLVSPSASLCLLCLFLPHCASSASINFASLYLGLSHCASGVSICLIVPLSASLYL